MDLGGIVTDDKATLEYLGVTLEFLGYIRKELLEIEPRSVFFSKLISFDTDKLNLLVHMAEKARGIDYDEQNLLNHREIILLKGVVARYSNEILFTRALQHYIPK